MNRHKRTLAPERVTQENLVSLGVDVAFEVLPAFAEAALKRSNIDELAKKIAISEVHKFAIGTENAAELYKEKKK